jgi:IS605 OrfB family transposase
MAKQTSSYGIEIKHAHKIFYKTITLFNDAVTFCIDAFEKEWTELYVLSPLAKKTFAEKLIHSTKNSIAKYTEFDKIFKKMPSYMRRSAISCALGALSSYHSNYDNWVTAGSTGSAPTLQKKRNVMPTFYRDNSYSDGDGDVVCLKLFVNGDWNWVPFTLKHTDLQYIRKHCNMEHMSCPTLEKVHHKWFLRFSFEEEYHLGNKNYNEQTILAVDLGINTDAVCSVMKSDGTVLARKFINFASDKDLIYHTLNKIKKVSQESGPHNTTKLWRYVSFRNEELGRKIAGAIADYAVMQHCDVIVFEHLDTSGRKRGSKKQRLHMWRKNAIQNIVTHKAHKAGIRISRICAWNTSRLAYDGSGEVLRGKDAGFSTNRLCRFENGKIYNCDLSASYNIGARYFIREIQKSISAKRWSDIQAKVPECEKRTWCTYNTLLRINAAA